MHTALMDAEDILSGSAGALGRRGEVGNNALNGNWQRWMEQMGGQKRGEKKM